MNTLKLLAVGAVLVAAALPAAAQDKARQVAEIQIVGTQAVDRAEVLQRIETKVGQVYDQAVADRDRAKLMDSGLFKSVEISKIQKADGVQVVIRLTEQVRVGNVSFLRNKAFSRGDLVKELPFSTDAALNEATVQAGRQAIINKYKSAGYDFIKVEAKQVGPNQVVYDIVEGAQVTVTSVRFNGNQYFTSFTLRRKVETSARWWPFVEGRLNTEQVDRDVHVLRNLYVDEGFLDASVSYRPDFSSVDKSHVVIPFNITEGRRYRVRNVRFEGNKLFGDSQLGGGMKLTKGAFYTAENAKADMKGMHDKYGQAGYVEAQILPKRLFLREPAGLVDLVFEVKEGQSYSVGKVDIRGNTITQEEKIRNWVRPVPGQVLDATALERARQRLLEMGLFEDVKTSIYGKGAATRDILVEVKEGQTAQFMVGAGVSSRDGLVGTVSFRQRNFDLFGWPTFKGAGQTLAVVAEPGTEMMRFRVEWFDPAIGNTDYSLGTKVAFFQRDRETYTERRVSLPIVSLGRRFPNDWATELSFRLDNVNVGSLDATAPPEVLADEGSHTLAGVRAAVVKDRTDSRFLPSEGDRWRLSYEQVGGTDTFGHADASYAVYRTLYTDALGRKHIITGRVSGGWIVGDAPVFEKLYAGGIGSIRGFHNRGISPRSAGTDEPIGGKFEMFAGLEYSVPIVGDDLRGVVFLDTGTVEDSVALSSYRAAVGFGIEWRVKQLGPMPMQFYFAVPIAKGADDDTEVFSFSVGWMW